jgi:DnaJ-class molecular chaperone
MDWALKLIESGSVAAPEKLEGTLRMYLKMGIKFYVILLAASLAVGGAVLWSSRDASTHQVVSTTESPARGRDTQVALTLSTGEAAHGKTVAIAIPESDEKVTVKIPAGLRDGSRLRLRGKGAQGVAGGPNGDLYITVHIA